MAIAGHEARELKAGDCLLERTDPVACSDLEDGPQLALMHRLHDPDGALFATLP
jgi:hypothetical protein